MSDGDTSSCMPPDKAAAHVFLTELRTRIATQRLPHPHGDEARALESLYELFGLARTAVRDHPGCRAFADLTITALNRDLRPFTARWHRKAMSGILSSRDGGVRFRAELIAVQDDLRRLAAELYAMAYDETMPLGAMAEEDAANMRTMLRFETEALRTPLVAGIPDTDLMGPVEAAKLNAAERAEILARRGAPSDAEVFDTTGLALSGGGIRSASFCLGVAQVLADRGILGDVDLVSTVSGGGFTGAFLRRRIAEEGTDAVARPLGPDTGPIRDLRRRAAYLATRTPREMGALLGSLLAGMVLNWTAPAAIIAALTALVLWLNGPPVAMSWDWLPIAVILPSVAGFLLFALMLKRRREAAIRALSLCLGLSGIALAGIAVGWLYALSDRLLEGGPGIRWALVATSIGAALPAISRILPQLGTAWIRRLGMRVVMLLAGVAVPALMLLWAFALYRYGAAQGDVGALRVLGAAVGLGAIAALFMDINLTGPHRLYRDRLGRSFVATRDDEAPDLPLAALPDGHAAPYLLVNTVANFPNSRTIRLQERQGDFFLMSKHWCGAPVTGYRPTGRWHVGGKPLDLATAIATSGAAVAPHMALLSVRPARALMSFLNLRLGLWIRTPGDSPDRHDSARPGALRLLQEMFGFGMAEDRPWLMLTDGAHLDNSAIYELLRRRTRFVVAVDGSADPQTRFETLITLVRHANIDLGVRIDLDLDEVRPDPESGLAPAHGVLARITYPDGGPGKPAGVGLLLFIKLSLTGDEPELIRGYHAAQPAFPNQTTADQFFDEHQFEAYRLLGAHAAISMFEPALTPPPEDAPVRLAGMRDWLERLAGTIPPPRPHAREEDMQA